MTVSKKQIQTLGEMVEKIIFDGRNLEELKDLIMEVSAQRIPARKLKEKMIEIRGEMLNRILQLFPFYNKSIFNKKEIDTFGNGNSDIKKELEEKNNLLKHLGNKLQELEIKLQKEFVE
jgi:hypothetical protein